MSEEEFEELFGNVPFKNIEKIKEYINKNFVSKEQLKKFFSERLVKYNDADDGKYDKPYLTRGELELVDRYGECKEIAEILLKEKIEFPKECISKDKIRDKIEKLYKEYERFESETIKDIIVKQIQVLKEILGEE